MMDQSRFVMMGQVADNLNPAKITPDVVDIMNREQAEMVIMASMFKTLGDAEVVTQLLRKVMEEDQS